MKNTSLHFCVRQRNILMLLLVLIISFGFLAGCKKKSQQTTSSSTSSVTDQATTTSISSQTTQPTTTTTKGRSGEVPTPTTKPITGPNNQKEYPGWIESASGNMIVSSPQKDSKITSPVKIGGSARYAFQNKVYARIKDKNGNVIGTGEGDLTLGGIPITGSLYGHFEFQVSFNAPTPTGTVEVFSHNDQGQEQDIVIVAVKF